MEPEEKCPYTHTHTHTHSHILSLVCKCCQHVPWTKLASFLIQLYSKFGKKLCKSENLIKKVNPDHDFSFPQ